MNLKLESYFPRWKNFSRDPNVSWTETYDLSNDDVFFRILGLVAGEQSYCSSRGSDAFNGVCEAIGKDVIALQLNPPQGCGEINLEYLQFEVSLFPLNVALNRGDLGRTHDWILNGFGDRISHEVERLFFTDRMDVFLESNVRWIAGNRTNSLIDWVAAFYYYCWRRAALFEAANSLIPATLKLIDQALPAGEQVLNAIQMLLNWTAGYDHPIAQSLASMLEELFEDPSVPEESRARIAVQLATTIGRFSSQEPKDWAVWTLDNVVHLLREHEHFQVLWALVETESDWDRVKPEILGAVERYAQEMKQLVRTPTKVVESADLRSGLLNPAFFTLHRFARSDDFLHVLSLWYGVSDQRRIQSRVLFVGTNHITGIVYLGSRSQSVALEEECKVEALTEITNRALGMTLSVQGEPIGPAVPNRPGIPAYTEGLEFARVLQNIYAFESVDSDTLIGAKALISFPAYPHPLQALMSAARDGASLPLASSLEEPLPDRSLSRALLWSADNDFTSGFEIHAVQDVLTNAGVECDLVNGFSGVPEDFIKKYADPVYDLIWIAGHGAYDHWKAGSAQFLAGQRCAVGIDDLHGWEPRSEGRRLLVLNICDGGVSAVLGGIHKLGLAPMLARSEQATVSHLWPVEPRMAAAFGVLLANELCQSGDFFRAFERTLSLIRQPWARIILQVRDLVPSAEIVSRLENTNQDTENIFHWGSPCFFQ